jgi:hypothetical protein
MKPSTYFRTCLLLPIVIPLIALPLTPGNALASILALSLVVAGVPYIFFAIATWFLLKKQSQTTSIPRCVLFAPLLLLPIETIALMIYSAYLHGISVDSFIGVLVVMPLLSLYTLGVGYLYVGLGSLIYVLLRKTGYIQFASASGL